MRSRPRVRAYFADRVLVPGLSFHATLRFDSKTRTPYDGLLVTLVCNEARFDRTNPDGTTVFHGREVIRGRTRFPAGVLQPGSEEFVVEFDLPENVPPTHRSTLSHVEYVLMVHVRIPWWLDRRASYPVIVSPPPTAPPPARAVVYTTQRSDHTDDQPILELSLEDDAVQSSGELRGALALSGLGGRTLRRIELVLHTLETPLVRSTSAQTTIDRHAWTIHDGAVAEGETVPFLVRVPKLLPAIETDYIRVEHQLRAVAVVLFGDDLVVRAPLRWFNVPTATPRTTIAPPVGARRRVAVWKSAMATLEQTGVTALRFDPETERATFAIGAIEITVHEDHASPPTMRAHYTFPSTGLDVHLAERARRNALVAKLLPEVQRRFVVTARDTDQAEAWLHGKLSSALIAFDDVDLRDDAIDVARKGGVYQLRGLLSFLERVVGLGIALSTSRVPPPVALTHALGPYQTFATATGCVLRAGDLSLRRWTVRGAVLDLEHRFEDEHPVESRLWMHVEPGTNVASMLDVLREETQLPVITEASRVGVVLPLVHDPARAMDAADVLARTAARVLAGATGPYR